MSLLGSMLQFSNHQAYVFEEEKWIVQPAIHDTRISGAAGIIFCFVPIARD